MIDDALAERVQARVGTTLKGKYRIERVTLLALSLPGLAVAGEPSASDKDTSRNLYADGMRLLAAGDAKGAEFSKRQFRNSARMLVFRRRELQLPG